MSEITFSPPLGYRTTDSVFKQLRTSGLSPGDVIGFDDDLELAIITPAAPGTIESTTNLLAGDGAGAGVDSGIDPADVAVTADLAGMVVTADLAAYVPITREINSHFLDGDINLTTGDINSIADKRYVTDAQLTVLGNTSGTNTGNQTISLTGDVTGSGTGTFATTIAAGAVDIAMLSATGTPGGTTYLRGDNAWATIAGGGDALKADTLDQFADVTQTSGKTLAITENTTLSGGTHSGTNTGDQTVITLADVYPIGSIYISVVSTNPATLFGIGTWTAFGAGKMLVGLDSGDTDFDTVEETGGAKTKTIAQANLPNISTGAGTAHTHVQDAHTHLLSGLMRTATTGSDSTVINESADASSTKDSVKTTDASTATNQNESTHTHSLGGSGTALNVVNPYIVVYIWKRTA